VAFSGRLTLVYSIFAVAAFAQIHPHAGARATVKLDAIAREETRQNLLHPGRIVHRPVETARPLANGGAAPAMSPRATVDPDPGYTVYGGFAAILDPYGATPPDTGGAAGPRHVVTMLNSLVAIQSRSGAILPNYPIDLNQFWSGLGDFTDTFDPRLQYDAENDRWIASAGVNAGAPNAALLIGVSQTGDPGGNWNQFRIDVGATGHWADYPVLGFNGNWIVVSANMFRLPPQGAYDRTELFVFNKSELYRNGDDKYVTFGDNLGEFCPARDYDQVADTFYWMQAFGGENGTIRISVLKGPPGAEQFIAGANAIAIQDSWAENSPDGDDFAPQRNSYAKVDTGDSRLQNCILRAGTIWCAHTVFLPADAPNSSAAQWFQVDPAASQPLQLGRIEDPSGANFYAFPSIAVNGNSDALIGYTRFSLNGYPSAGFALRAASDPPNTAPRNTIYKRGEAPYIAIGYDEGSNRWGDFSATMVDPVDDLTFWTIQEYAAAPTEGYLGRWGTWWAQIVPPSAGMSCAYAVAASNAAFDAGGGTATIAVATGAGCPWMAAGDAGWLTILSGSPGAGSGTVVFSAGANAGAAGLQGTVTIAGQAIAVSVSGAR